MKTTTLSLLFLSAFCTELCGSSYEELENRVAAFISSHHTEVEGKPVEKVVKEEDGPIFADLKNCSDPRTVRLGLSLSECIWKCYKAPEYSLSIVLFVEYCVEKVGTKAITDADALNALEELIDTGITKSILPENKDIFSPIESSLKALKLKFSRSLSDFESPSKKKGSLIGSGGRRRTSLGGRRSPLTPATQRKNTGTGESGTPPNTPANGADQEKEAEEQKQRERDQHERDQRERDQRERDQRERDQRERELRERELREKELLLAKHNKGESKNVTNNTGSAPAHASWAKKIAVVSLIAGIVGLIGLELLGSNPSKRLQKGGRSVSDTLSNLLNRKQ